MATLEEYKRFVANEPEAQREIRTLELWHPDFSQVYRFANEYNDFTGTLESTAPRNSGEEVTFTAATLLIKEPSERGDTDQVISVTVGATDDVLAEMLDSITGTGYLSQIEVIYRKYYSGDVSQPAVPALYLYASGVNFDNATSATLTVEDTDLAVKRSGALYTLEEFPGLSE